MTNTISDENLERIKELTKLLTQGHEAKNFFSIKINSGGDHSSYYVLLNNTPEAKEELIKSLQKELADSIREPL